MSDRNRDTTALALGAAIGGLLAYVVFALTTRALGPEAAAPVSVLWSYWSFAGAAFTFPLQHWITTSVTVHGEGAVRSTLPRLSLIVVAASLLVGALAWIGREPLFHRPGFGFPTLVVLVTLGSALIGVMRGGLSASGRFVALAWSLVAENVVRCVAVAALILADVRAAVGYGLCLVAGHLVPFLWPSSLQFGRHRTSIVAHAPFAFLTGAALAQLLGQIMLTGGPVVLALAGGTPSEVTALFATLALFRAPYILALGLVAQLTGRVTMLVVEGRTDALRRLRTVMILATAALVIMAGLVGALGGPELVMLIFGPEVHISATNAALAALASALAVANLVVTVAVTALLHPSAVVHAWLIAGAAAAVGFVSLVTLQPPDQIVWCLVIGEGVAFAALVFQQARGTDQLRSVVPSPSGPTGS